MVIFSPEVEPRWWCKEDGEFQPKSGEFCQVKWRPPKLPIRSSSSEYVPFIFDLHQDGLRKQLQENWTRFFSQSGCHHRRASRIHQEPLRYEAGACKMPGFWLVRTLLGVLYSRKTGFVNTISVAINCVSRIGPISLRFWCCNG